MNGGEFTEDEKTEILRFLGYADWQALAASIQLGYPAASEPMFLVVDSFKRLTPPARSKVRDDLCNLRAIECQLADARSRFKASKIGELTMNPRETFQLRQELDYWTTRLADDLGVMPNPYSQATNGGMPGGINAKVSG